MLNQNIHIFLQIHKRCRFFNYWQ